MSSQKTSMDTSRSAPASPPTRRLSSSSTDSPGAWSPAPGGPPKSASCSSRPSRSMPMCSSSSSRMRSSSSSACQRPAASPAPHWAPGAAALRPFGVSMSAPLKTMPASSRMPSMKDSSSSSPPTAPGMGAGCVCQAGGFAVLPQMTRPARSALERLHSRCAPPSGGAPSSCTPALSVSSNFFLSRACFAGRRVRRTAIAASVPHAWNTVTARATELLRTRGPRASSMPAMMNGAMSCCVQEFGATSAAPARSTSSCPSPGRPGKCRRR
mmetsp:Transcript_89198/g.252928  ORF Transcript_89198/g.252928 Transcript_89198/m.252928 type:complete len:269 (-) Transcript_89198:1000-1806(-)